MQYLVDGASWVLLLSGALFAVIGGIGLMRLPDLYTRMHGAGITDTLGAGLILLGLTLQAGFSLLALKLIGILFFLMVTSPTSTHALAKSARSHGIEPRLATEEDE